MVIYPLWYLWCTVAGPHSCGWPEFLNLGRQRWWAARRPLSCDEGLVSSMWKQLVSSPWEKKVQWSFQDPKMEVREYHISGHILWWYSHGNSHWTVCPSYFGVSWKSLPCAFWANVVVATPSFSPCFTGRQEAKNTKCEGRRMFRWSAGRVGVECQKCNLDEVLIMVSRRFTNIHKQLMTWNRKVKCSFKAE